MKISELKVVGDDRVLLGFIRCSVATKNILVNVGRCLCTCA